MLVGWTSDSIVVPTWRLVYWWEPGALAVVGPAGVYLLGFFCSCIQFCALLGPCLCFVSFLCLGLCILGDGASISWGSFMQTKHLCVLIHIRTKGEDGAEEQV